MDQFGTLLISIAVVTLSIDGRISMKPHQVSKVSVTRGEALMMMREHKNQVKLRDVWQHYDYDWKPEAESWNDMT